MSTESVVPVYGVQTVDLSTAQPQPQAFQIDSPMVMFTKVGSPVTLRIGGPNAPPISIGQPSKFVFCEGPVVDIFLSWEAGSGTVEFLYSPDMEPDFSSAGVTEPPVILNRFAPADFGPLGTNLLVTDIAMTNNNRLSKSIAGVGYACCPDEQYLANSLGGMYLKIRADGSNKARVLAWPPLGAPCQGLPLICNPHGITNNMADWMRSVEDTIQVGITGASGAVRWATFGVGTNWWSAAMAWEGVLVGFYTDLLTNTWHAKAWSVKNGVYDYVHVDQNLTGVLWGDINTLKVEWGISGGTPFLKWYVNGTMVHEASLPFTNPLTGLASYILQAPAYCVAKNDATSTDEVEMWGLLGAGAIVRESTS